MMITILVWKYYDDHHLEACIIQYLVYIKCIGSTSSVIVWSVIPFSSRSCFIHSEGNLNSHQYIRDVLEAEMISFFQIIPDAISTEQCLPNIFMECPEDKNPWIVQQSRQNCYTRSRTIGIIQELLMRCKDNVEQSEKEYSHRR